jgi:hypothetical protein
MTKKVTRVRNKEVLYAAIAQYMGEGDPTIECDWERDKLAEEWKMILEQLSEDLKVIRDAITAEKDEVLIRLSRKGFAKWL